MHFGMLRHAHALLCDPSPSLILRLDWTSVRVDGMKLSRDVDSFEISGPPDAENTAADPHKIDIQQKRTTIAGEIFNYEFPPHSITLLKLMRIGG